MQSWSDSFLNSVNDYSQILGLVALFLTFVFGYFAYATAKESTRRSSERETASEERANSLQKKADEAIQRAQVLEASQLPRTITPAQIAIFNNSIAGTIITDSIGVYTAGNDAEAAQYADQFRRMLTNAGYNAGKMNGISFGANFPKGVAIVLKDNINRPLGSDALLKAFQAMDPSIRGYVETNLKFPESILIIVGGKPSP